MRAVTSYAPRRAPGAIDTRSTGNDAIIRTLTEALLRREGFSSKVKKHPAPELLHFAEVRGCQRGIRIKSTRERSKRDKWIRAENDERNASRSKPEDHSSRQRLSVSEGVGGEGGIRTHVP